MKNPALDKNSGQRRLIGFFGTSRQFLSADPRGLITFTMHAGGICLWLWQMGFTHDLVQPANSRIFIFQARIQEFPYDRLTLQYRTLVVSSCISFQKNHPTGLVSQQQDLQEKGESKSRCQD